MLLVLSQYSPEDTALEQRIAKGRAELFIQPASTAAVHPLPPAIRRRADAIVHVASTTFIDGTPGDYPRCQIVVRSGVGYDKVDLAGWGSVGVACCNVPDYGTSEVADHALALMLALTRGTATYHDALRTDPAGNWDHAKAPLVRRLRGSTFGVVGLGRIGLAAALRARAFGMEIAFYDPYLAPGMEITVGARRVTSLVALMATSDVVSIHVPSNHETHGLIAVRELAAAKPGLVLINTARGTIVDLDALYNAMKSGRIAAAGLDVLPKEPADSEHPLIKAWVAREAWLEGRLTLSPHAAFYSPDALTDLRTKGIKTALLALETGRVINCVNAGLINEAKQKARQLKMHPGGTS